MRAAIYGAGSLGTILGAFLTKNGGQIDLVNRNTAHVSALLEMTGPVKKAFSYFIIPSRRVEPLLRQPQVLCLIVR